MFGCTHPIKHRSSVEHIYTPCAASASSERRVKAACTHVAVDDLYLHSILYYVVRIGRKPRAGVANRNSVYDTSGLEAL